MTNPHIKPQHPSVERGLVVRYRDTHDIRIVQNVEPRDGVRQVVRMQAGDGSAGWGAWLSTFWDDFETVDALSEESGNAQKAKATTDDAIRADEREQWAHYFESTDASVGSVPLTYALAAEMLRGSRPFGVAKGHTR